MTQVPMPVRSRRGSISCSGRAPWRGVGPDVRAGGLHGVADGLGGVVDEAISTPCGRPAASPGSARSTRAVPGRPHRLQGRAHAVAQAVDGLTGVDEAGGGQQQRHDDADDCPDHRVQGPVPAGAPRVGGRGGEHDQRADGYLSRRSPGEVEDQFGDGEGHHDEQRHREAGELEGVAHGQRTQHAEHHRGAALECRAERRPDRHLHHHQGRQARRAPAGLAARRPRAIPHARPACQSDLATVPTSVDVGGVQDTAWATSDHSRPIGRLRRSASSPPRPLRSPIVPPFARGTAENGWECGAPSLGCDLQSASY